MIKLELVDSLKLQCISLKEKCLLLEYEKNVNMVILQRTQLIQELAEKYGFDSRANFKLDDNTLIPINQDVK